MVDHHKLTLPIQGLDCLSTSVTQRPEIKVNGIPVDLFAGELVYSATWESHVNYQILLNAVDGRSLSGASLPLASAVARYALRYAAFCNARFLAHRYAMLFVTLAC